MTEKETSFFNDLLSEWGRFYSINHNGLQCRVSTTDKVLTRSTIDSALVLYSINHITPPPGFMHDLITE